MTNQSIIAYHCNHKSLFYQGTQVEQLCGNICAEATQHFYNMHMFNELLDSFDEESITIHGDVRWYDNSATIQLLTEQVSHISSLLILPIFLGHPCTAGRQLVACGRTTPYACRFDLTVWLVVWHDF